ncbi:hypothetical protein TSAR_015637 [Trichomalopsis sarcophagae]|uniref:Integrase SAM-like N-terminal domain-containing protein n=1 Tax=Trichomalopsis sarcophagae TaxID=543379 RepID=A0A232EHK5_9HYME|nr:hypothetical protein TSAR_015637 [Trichomalopsis sarcophagae]
MSLKYQNFLISFQNCNRYGTLNTYRSVLSLILDKEIGNDSVIKRFCKGTVKLKPQTPKYTCTWNPDTVLQYLENLYPHENLNLEKLTKKFVTLLALIEASTAQRVQTLSKIKIANININEMEPK